MAKPRVKLDEIVANDAVTLQRDHVTTSAAPAPATATGRPHVSLYLPKAVQREIKRIALEADRKPHDVYMDAIDMLLKHYGRPSLAELRKTE